MGNILYPMYLYTHNGSNTIGAIFSLTSQYKVGIIVVLFFFFYFCCFVSFRSTSNSTQDLFQFLLSDINLGVSYGVQGSNLGQLCSRQASYLLYFHSGLLYVMTWRQGLFIGVSVTSKGYHHSGTTG